MTYKRQEEKTRRGTPVELRGAVDPRGICEVVLELEPEGEDVLVPLDRKEFGTYELHEASAYIRFLAPRASGFQT